jgi:hypothetical protein
MIYKNKMTSTIKNKLDYNKEFIFLQMKSGIEEKHHKKCFILYSVIKSLNE